ncbi:hypothetical protein JHD48_05690 [Sulfurimonas sp. SAG-AH-194-I05]|nr:hypothetical protein [Sulfurimonas sp. SAG-AH-194-I05]MDF1875217.1 hypothetical protein [Sulfurimonas sp. SAG-AH-194-I05]
MSTLTVRKNFNFEKELVDKASTIIKEKNKNFTEVLTHYFQAIIKDPLLIDAIEEKAKKRTGGFIGMLDGKVGTQDYKDMHKDYHENIS